MEYRTLGNSGLQLSAITYGAFAIGGSMWGGNEQQASIDAIHASLDHGVTTLDTAPFYGMGLSEELIGKALQGKDRSKVQLLTKFGLVWDGSNRGKGEFFFNAGNTPVYRYAAKANIIKELEESLRRLRTDYIDLLQLHWPDATTPIAETMEALEQLVKEGKIRAAGVSNYDVVQMQEAAKTITLASNQVSFSMLNRGIEKDLVPYTRAHNIGIIAYSPMERGLLTGKYFTDAKLKADDHRNDYFNQFNLEKIKAFLDEITPMATRKNVSLSQLVLRWTTLQPGISIVLAGARNAEQAIANAAAMEVEISAAEMTSIHMALARM